MNQIHIWILIICIAHPLVGNAENKAGSATPYGSSQFYVWPGLAESEELKVAFDFNFNDPNGVERAMYPVSFMLKTIQEYGPVSFEPNMIVVSHGSEVVVWAKQNYEKYKEVVDRAARLAELGVKYEVCVVATSALGFKPEDFHSFIRVVPLGTYALAFHENRGYAVISGAATIPMPLINPKNRDFVGKLHRDPLTNQ